ncbi:hypothetical protein J6590_012685 [Homalodisca vitripennis]|nr:hypothetical protein J6590_012685 [Homalodisca vitripennis]
MILVSYRLNKQTARLPRAELRSETSGTKRKEEKDNPLPEGRLISSKLTGLNINAFCKVHAIHDHGC